MHLCQIYLDAMRLVIAIKPVRFVESPRSHVGMLCRSRIQEAFETLGLAPTLQEYDANAIEIYTCQHYIPVTTITTVKEMCWFLFSKRPFTEKLPPTKSVLIQMTNRAKYVAMIWKQCGVACPILPEPTSHWWRLEVDNRLRPVPT
jgi:hypothetical protein